MIGLMVVATVTEYVSTKQRPMNEKYVDGSVSAMVTMMVRGGCLPPVWGSTMMS